MTDTFKMTINENSIQLTMSNRMVRKLEHEKQTLRKTYVETLRQHLPKLVSTISCEVLEERLRSLCTSTESCYKKQTGRAKSRFLEKEHTLNVTVECETSELSTETSPENIDTASDALINALQSKLHESTRKETELEGAVATLTGQIESLQSRCKDLEGQNSSLSVSLCQYQASFNQSKKVGEGSKKTDTRKLKLAAEGIETTLENFLSSFGLNLEEMVVSDLKGILHKIVFPDSGCPVVQHSVTKSFQGRGITSYNDLSESDKRVVHEVAALLDEHSCSNSFWQELSRWIKGLPSVGLINSFREIVDGEVRITKTPGKAMGAQVSFRADLEHVIMKLPKNKGKPCAN